jgi:hypothetical protein
MDRHPLVFAHIRKTAARRLPAPHRKLGLGCRTVGSTRLYHSAHVLSTASRQSLIPAGELVHLYVASSAMLRRQRCVFVAYPSQPSLLSESIRRGCELANGRGGPEFRPWEQNDIAGRPLSDPIFDAIATSRFVVADVTQLNFNVTFEIGYAVGINKRALLIRNSSYATQDALIRSIGIFDTLGYTSYANSVELADVLTPPIDTTPLKTDYPKNKTAPIYILETPSRSDAMVRILARVSKARLGYRSFAPSESARLSATEAILHVASSFGVLVPLLSDDFEDAFVHNIRAAFIAGIAHGLSKNTLILQEARGPNQIDVLDYVKSH